MVNVILILFPTQLFETKYLDKVLDHSEEDQIVKTKIILFWEHDYFFNKFKYHKLKLAFHRATMQSYHDILKKKYKVEYVENIEKSQEKQIESIISKNKIDEIRVFNPIEKELIKLVDTNKLIGKSSVPIIKYPSIYFLGASNFNTNTQIQESIKTTRHDLFYKYQRIKYNIMVKKVGSKVEPEGSKWSFDRENRDKFPSNEKEPPLPEYKSKTRNECIEEAIDYVNKNFSDHYGLCQKENFIFPITHEESDKWLDEFVKKKLDLFGKYEDALSSKIKFGYHSLLSAVNNIGLITTKQILKKVENYKKNIASKEGFIRQLIGWREYCYFVYDKYYETLVKDSIYKKNKYKIPKKIWEGKTLIPVIDNIIQTVNMYAYSHHIERLMGIGNFLLLIGVSPDEIYTWFQTMYIDAYDVFMVPNVYGMLLYSMAGKSRMMTRPYFCSSNYLMKMSDYKRSEITFGKTTCKWDEVFDALYYNLISDNADVYEKIYASASSVSRWKSFSSSKKKELLDLSKKYKDWIHKN